MLKSPFHQRGIWLGLAAVCAAYLFLRVGHLGHLLSFDEAWNALAVRGLAQGVTTPFTFNFFRHPPVYMLLGEAVVGQAGGDFAVRLAGLSLALNAAALVALFVLCRAVWDEATALWVAAACALMPAGIFYDTWIKQDPVAVLGGLIALIFWVKGRPAAAGVSLGLAFLGKGTAVLYAQALFWLAVGRRQPGRGWVPLGKAVLVCLLVGGWWYACLWRDGAGFAAFFSGSSAQSKAFAEPWWFYAARLPRHLGLGGTFFAAVGAVGLAIAALRGRAREPAGFWPLLLVVPALGVLSVSHGKPPWLIIPLLPGWAALVGLGACQCHRWAFRGLVALQRRGRVPSPRLLGGLCALIPLAALVPRPVVYETYLEAESRPVSSLSVMSRDVARAVSRVTAPTDRLLLTSFYYEKTQYCPVFHYYVEPRDVVLRPHDTPCEELVGLIKEYALDWAVLSPGPQPVLQPVARELAARLAVRPLALEGAVIFPVHALRP